MPFNERLRLLRTQKGLSQAELAKFIKVSKSSINMYERGEREPNLETLENIADFFNVDMDYLLGKSDQENKNKWLSSLTDNQGHRSSAYTDDEKLLVSKYRALDERGKASVWNTLNHEFASLPGEKAKADPKQA